MTISVAEETSFELLQLPPHLLSLVASGLRLSERLRLAVVCRAFRDLLGSNPQLLSVVDFDQYAEAGKQQCQPHCPPQRAAVLADFEEWQPWGAEPAELQPALDQLPAFLSWLGANAAHVQRLRAAPASDWSHVAQAPQVSTLCSRLICLQGLRSLRLEVRSLLHIGIWVSPMRCLRRLSIVAGSLAVSRHLGALPSLALLELQCSPQEGWDHDLHFERLEVEPEEGPCLPPSLERLCLRRLEAVALPPGLAACGALLELQLDHVVLDGEPRERYAALSALTALSALRLDCVPAVAVPAELGSVPGLRRLSLRHAAGWLPASVQPADASLAQSFERLAACPALTTLTFVGFDETPAALWSLTQLRELVLGMPPARGAHLARLPGLRRLSFQYDNARAPSLLSEDAVQACSRLSTLHLGGTPTQPGVSLPLLALLLRRLQLGAPRLCQLSTACPGVEAGLRRILELEGAGGTGYALHELEPAGPWMRQMLQQAGGAARARAAEAAWLRGVWVPGGGPPEWLDPWHLPAWDAE